MNKKSENKNFQLNENGLAPLEITPTSRRSVKSLMGFTLMELMVVIAIIALLAGIMTPNVARRLERAKMTRTEADIAAMETAIAMYENDLGSYPPFGIDFLETYLVGIDSAGVEIPANNPRWNGPYIKGIEKDPWGQKYVYLKNRCPRKPSTCTVATPATCPNNCPPIIGTDYPANNDGGSVNAPDSLSYYIYSTGKNKATGTGKNADDINNWDVDKSWKSEY